MLLPVRSFIHHAICCDFCFDGPLPCDLSWCFCGPMSWVCLTVWVGLVCPMGVLSVAVYDKLHDQTTHHGNQ